MTKATLETESLDVIADRGYFHSEEILACEEAAITVTLPKPTTSNSKAEGRFGKQDFPQTGAWDEPTIKTDRPHPHRTAEFCNTIRRKMG